MPCVDSCIRQIWPSVQARLDTASRLAFPRRLPLFLRVGPALRAFLEIMVAAAAIGAAFGGRVGVEHRGHSQECTKRFPVAAIA